MRETEVLFFLIVVIMIRSRKTGNVSMINYLTSGFMYAKCANLILFFMSDPRLGLVYALLFLLQVFSDYQSIKNPFSTVINVLFLFKGLLLPEPTYKGPENITYFRGNSLTEELNRLECQCIVCRCQPRDRNWVRDCHVFCSFKLTVGWGLSGPLFSLAPCSSKKVSRRQLTSNYRVSLKNGGHGNFHLIHCEP